MTIMRVSTQVTDLAVGRFAGGLPVSVEAGANGGLAPVGEAVTDDEGFFFVEFGPTPGGDLPDRVRVVIDTAGYFAEFHGTVVYPSVTIDLMLAADRSSYHLPVQLGTYSYSTHLAPPS